MNTETRIGRWRSRLLFWSLVPLFLALIGAAVYTYLAYRRAAAELVMQRDQQVAFLSAARLQTELSTFSQTLAALARSPEINSPSLGTRRQALAEAGFRLDAFDGGVILLDHFGKVTASMPERSDAVGQDWSDRAFFHQLLTTSNPVFSDTVSEGSDHNPVVLVGVPVLDGSGGFSGALVGMFRIGQQTVSSFYASIVRLRIEQTGTTYVVDSQGRILFDSASQFMGLNFSDQVNAGVPFDGKGGVVHERDVNGRDVLASYAPIPGTPWTLVTQDDWDTLTRSTRQYANLLIGVIAVGMFLPAVGVGVIVRQSTRETLERERHDQEARVARHMQLSMIPEHVPVLPGWDMAAHHQPGRGSASDFYDFLLLPDGRLMVCLGSIHGSDARVGILMVTTRAGLRGAVVHNHTPSAALTQTNALLCPEMPAASSIDCLCAILDPSTGLVTYSNAGQAAPLHSCAGKVEELPQRTQALGTATESRYGDHVVAINPGDGLVIYSAGLVHARDTEGEPFGVERLCALLESHSLDAPSLIQELLAEIHGGRPKTQRGGGDGTLIVLIRDPEPAPGGSG